MAMKPDWLKTKIPSGKNFHDLKALFRSGGLHTVCEEAVCPNVAECWGRGTATLMILGDTCTRSCGFCAVKTGRPPTTDWDEPERVAKALAALYLKHVVITSVDRDDLPDGGAAIFAETVRQTRAACPGMGLEVLTPDFKAIPEALETVFASRPDIFSHNVETVARLTKRVRPQAQYDRSLLVLRAARTYGLPTKSAVMVGLGETLEELFATITDLREAGCSLLAVGQYLQPRRDLLPVARYYHPDEFKAIYDYAKSLGFSHVAAAPFVRSSYQADLAVASVTH